MTPDGYCETVEELCEYIVKYASSIWVRVKVGDGYESIQLDACSAADAIKFVCGWIKDGRTPARIRSEEEIAKEG